MVQSSKQTKNNNFAIIPGTSALAVAHISFLWLSQHQHMLLKAVNTCKKPVSVKNTARVLRVLTDAMEIGD